MTEGQIIFQSETVTITPSRAFLDRKTYLISDLLSISVKKEGQPKPISEFYFAWDRFGNLDFWVIILVL